MKGPRWNFARLEGERERRIIRVLRTKKRRWNVKQNPLNEQGHQKSEEFKDLKKSSKKLCHNQMES